jgi:hypothetical protein
VARLHLFELEDQSWWPSSWRQMMTDYLVFMIGRDERPLRKFVAKLAELMQRTRAHHLVDLASGSGGPVPRFVQMLRRDHDLPATATLTDLYPNVAELRAIEAASDGAISAKTEPVDATAVPADLTGVRLMCNGFHHLPPAAARGLLADATRAGQPVAIFEVVERTPLAILSMLFVPLVVLVITPWLRPFRWARLFWTYVIPVLPLAIAFDGLVSCVRVYKPDELRALTEGLHGMQWEAGRLKIDGLPAAVTYLTGHPTAPTAA